MNDILRKIEEYYLVINLRSNQGCDRAQEVITAYQGYLANKTSLALANVIVAYRAYEKKWELGVNKNA